VQLTGKKPEKLVFEDLIRDYKEKLYWHIRRMVVSHDDADDVLQNTFIKVYKNLDNFKGESQVYTWLYRIATNETITFLNKRAKFLKLSNESLQQTLVSNLTSDPYFDGDAAQLKLQEAINLLPPKQKQVFIMKYYEDLQYNEIAEVLNTSEGALKASYHHAVKKITQHVLNN